MQTLERRIAALETRDTQPYQWVWRNAGETDADAKARAGIVPGDKVIIFSWREHHAND